MLRNRFLLFFLLPFASSVFPQGSLTPPGAPAPTMKSLNQIEARTPISALPYTINVPGSYYLTSNLSVGGGDAITINASNVTLDLNGFNITSSASSATGNAIIIFSDNVTIRNGSITGGVTQSGGTFSGSGFADGIYSIFGLADVRVSNVKVYGCLNHAIYLGGSNSSVVESCLVYLAGGYGIYASVVRDSAARQTGQGIVADEISNSDGEAIASGATGIYASRAAQNCFGLSTSNFGIAGNGTVQNCIGVSNSGYGLSGYAVQNCYGISTSGVGLNGVVVTNSFGNNNSATNPAITGTIVHNCYGFNPSGPAINATYTVDGSAAYCGNSNGSNPVNGISAKNVINSYAEVASGSNINGISADVVQDSSVKVAITSAFGIFARIAQHSFVTLTATNGNNLSEAIDVTGEASDCYVLNSGNTLQPTGIVADGPGVLVKNCVVRNMFVGILPTGDDCVFKDNELTGNPTAIQADTNNNRIDGNRASCPAGGHAFVINGNSNLIIRNTTRDNGANPLIINGTHNSYGTYLNNINGGEITSSNPWANVSY